MVLEIREILREPNFYSINDASEAFGAMSLLTCYNLATLANYTILEPDLYYLLNLESKIYKIWKKSLYNTD